MYMEGRGLQIKNVTSYLVIATLYLTVWFYFRF